MEGFIDRVIDICSVEDLINGYVYDKEKESYTCVFCGEIFREGYIYQYGNKLCNAKKMVELHILEKHESSFEFLLNLDKKHTNLTDRQREIHNIIYNETDNRIIAEKMETTPATVRSYKFKMRERLRQAKVYMAIFSLIEEENEKDIEKLDDENIRDIAVYERLKKAENEDENLGKENQIDEIISENLEEIDIKNINLLIDKDGPSIKK